MIPLQLIKSVFHWIWNFTKKWIIAFLTWIQLLGIFAATYKTGVRQDFSEDIVLSFSFFSRPPPQCSFSLDSDNKIMHFWQGIHQQHQKVDFIFFPPFSGSHSPLYSFTVGKLQFLAKKTPPIPNNQCRKLT